jgi:hypothetical protein
MRKEIAEKWVAALRSGEYEQSAGFLQTRDGYCCLGVLCDLHMRETGRGEWRPPGSGDYLYTQCYRDDLGVDGEYTPPPGVREWADMEDDPCVRVQHPDGSVEPEDLVSLNDDGFSFAQLADLIEEQWESL